jgi:hypothetical protein
MTARKFPYGDFQLDTRAVKWGILHDDIIQPDKYPTSHAGNIKL